MMKGNSFSIVASYNGKKFLSRGNPEFKKTGREDEKNHL